MNEASAKIRVGPAGWQYPDWDGIVYPERRARDFDALVFIASYFNVIEINSTFYRTPSPKTARSWVERVSHIPDFRFTLKALQRFTHGKENPAADEIASFRSAIEPIFEADRLSCVLLQFPWSFREGAQSRRRIELLADAFDPIPVAVELRHGTWARPDSWRRLEATGMTICGIDQPVIGDSLRPGKFIAGSAGAYFRFHGRNYRNWFSSQSNRDDRYDYLYTRDQLQPWVDVIARAAQSSTPVSVILNNHFRGQAPANAFEIMAMLSGRRVPVPSTLASAHERLGDIADVQDVSGVADGWLFDPLPAENNQKDQREDAQSSQDLDVSR